MIKFVVMINKRGQTRLSHYYEPFTLEDKSALESELIRKCLIRDDTQCSFFTLRDMTIVYRRYASLFIIVGTTPDENELTIYELVQNIVETLDRHFENVCELDIIYNLDKAHFILNEMIANGRIIECNKSNILYPLTLYEKFQKSSF
nr:clathrin assembly protein [Theileria orientalis]